MWGNPSDLSKVSKTEVNTSCCIHRNWFWNKLRTLRTLEDWTSNLPNIWLLKLKQTRTSETELRTSIETTNSYFSGQKNPIFLKKNYNFPRKFFFPLLLHFSWFFMVKLGPIMFGKVRRTSRSNFERFWTYHFGPKLNFEPPEYHQKPNSLRISDSSFQD